MSDMKKLWDKHNYGANGGFDIDSFLKDAQAKLDQYLLAECYNGCLTGDCPHSKQTECFENLSQCFANHVIQIEAKDKLIGDIKARLERVKNTEGWGWLLVKELLQRIKESEGE